MASNSNETKISLQVGSELRIKNNGDIVIDNPELELAADDRAADAVLVYRLTRRPASMCFDCSSQWLITGI
jgi:hypothetical protein